jgi:ribonuclease BN (tRNA processing enzyme)
MRLSVVGCAGSFPGPDSAASCYLVEIEDTGRTWRLLLDLGNGALGPLQRLVDPRGLDAVLLTHLHPDHCLDLCGLFVLLRHHPQGPPATKLPVFGPPGTLERLVVAYGGPDGEPDLPEVFDVREWDDGHAVRLGPTLITPYRVEHPVEAYGLRLDHAGRSLAYTGDTDTCPALLKLARGADLFLAEASFQEGRDTVRGIHLTGLRAGQVAAAAGARRLVLTHLPVWTDPDVVLGEARTAFAGHVDLATPGRSYDLQPAPPSSEAPGGD